MLPPRRVSTIYFPGVVPNLASVSVSVMPYYNNLAASSRLIEVTKV